MKLIIALFLCLALATPAGVCRSDRPYLAVFCCPGFEVDWGEIDVDYFCMAFSWDQFDDFLRTTKKKAGRRAIEIELAVHGTGDTLALGYANNPNGDDINELASFGYVVNHIERIIGIKNVTLICEACHGGATYKHSIRGCKVEDCKNEDCNHVPKFPVYGGSGNSVNVDNYVFLQYRSKVRMHFRDLRDFEKEDPGNAQVKDSKEYKEYLRTISTFFHFLGQYYKP